MDDPILTLTRQLARLPGVGERSAGRLAHYIIANSQEADFSLADDLASALRLASSQVRLCELCYNFSSAQRCVICSDTRRDENTLCVVENVGNLRAFEMTGAFSGRYHVLHGVLSPLDGVGPKQLKIDALLKRVNETGITEVVLALNSNVPGDTTALYLQQQLNLLQKQGTQENTKVTRLASGIPMGGELEYLDQGTLERAYHDRRDF